MLHAECVVMKTLIRVTVTIKWKQECCFDTKTMILVRRMSGMRCWFSQVFGQTNIGMCVSGKGSGENIIDKDDDLSPFFGTALTKHYGSIFQ